MSNEYRPVKANAKGVTDIQIDFHYSLGGYSYATYKPYPRGYYVNVTPVTIRDEGTWRSVSFTAFTGYSYIIKEVSRKSNKAEAEARAIADSRMDQFLQEVCERNGLELA